MKKIFIDIHQSGTKVCVVEENELVEFWAEKKDTSKRVGNIYKGKVVNVLPGMQAAFVNVGLERNGFLYAGDTLVDDNEINKIANEKLSLRAGDEVLCQVVKDEFGTKGARITMNLSIPGRVLVMMPMIDYIGISKKITDDETRRRLYKLIDEGRGCDYGFIVRTEAGFADEEEILAEVEALKEKWVRIKKDYIKKPCFTLLFDEDDLINRTMRDMVRVDVEKVVVNDAETYEKICDEYANLAKHKEDIFELYEGNESMLGFYGLTRQIEKLVKRKVVLKNGAYLIVDRTEALTVIDVNTGKYVGDKNLEETVFKTNKIAAVEIAKQLRLRNIGGIVLIDFIDMVLPEHREGLLAVFQQELSKDRVKNTLVGMTGLGLVELTRKKTRSMLEAIMLQTCPYCNGDSYILSDEYVIMAVKEALSEAFNTANPPAVKVFVHPQIFSKMFALRVLEKECEGEWQGKRIYIIPDSSLHIEKFRIEQERNIVIDLPDDAKLLY